MKSNELEKLILAYETDVRFPDVSGIEHLDMLLARTKIEENKENLTLEQQARLAVADNYLVQQSQLFYKAISQIADLEQWRKNARATTSQWWWYLDVLAYSKPWTNIVEPTIV